MKVASWDHSHATIARSGLHLFHVVWYFSELVLGCGGHKCALPRRLTTRLCVLFGLSATQAWFFAAVSYWTWRVGIHIHNATVDRVCTWTFLLRGLDSISCRHWKNSIALNLHLRVTVWLFEAAERVTAIISRSVVEGRGWSIFRSSIGLKELCPRLRSIFKDLFDEDVSMWQYLAMLAHLSNQRNLLVLFSSP